VVANEHDAADDLEHDDLEHDNLEHDNLEHDHDNNNSVP
jgi:hypothetical protein